MASKKPEDDELQYADDLSEDDGGDDSFAPTPKASGGGGTDPAKDKKTADALQAFSEMGGKSVPSVGMPVASQTPKPAEAQKTPMSDADAAALAKRGDELVKPIPAGPTALEARLAADADIQKADAKLLAEQAKKASEAQKTSIVPGKGKDEKKPETAKEKLAALQKLLKTAPDVNGPTALSGAPKAAPDVQAMEQAQAGPGQQFSVPRFGMGPDGKPNEASRRLMTQSDGMTPTADAAHDDRVGRVWQNGKGPFRPFNPVLDPESTVDLLSPLKDRARDADNNVTQVVKEGQPEDKRIQDQDGLDGLPQAAQQPAPVAAPAAAPAPGGGGGGGPSIPSLAPPPVPEKTDRSKEKEIVDKRAAAMEDVAQHAEALGRSAAFQQEAASRGVQEAQEDIARRNHNAAVQAKEHVAQWEEHRKDATINPRRYVENMSFGAKLLAAVGMVAAGVGGGPQAVNMAFSHIQKAIDNDIDAQQKTFENGTRALQGRDTAFAKAYEFFGNSDAANLSAKIEAKKAVGELLATRMGTLKDAAGMRDKGMDLQQRLAASVDDDEEQRQRLIFQEKSKAYDQQMRSAMRKGGGGGGGAKLGPNGLPKGIVGTVDNIPITKDDQAVHIKVLSKIATMEKTLAETDRLVATPLGEMTLATKIGKNLLTDSTISALKGGMIPEVLGGPVAEQKKLGLWLDSAVAMANAYRKEITGVHFKDNEVAEIRRLYGIFETSGTIEGMKESLANMAEAVRSIKAAHRSVMTDQQIEQSEHMAARAVREVEAGRRKTQDLIQEAKDRADGKPFKK
jgi:hypothetical protein